MNDEFFSLGIERGIAHLQLNRPERLNTMAPPFFPALRDAVRALNDAGEARVLVISSTGKHFCAGMALDVFGGDDTLLATSSARARLNFQDSLRKLIECFSALDEARLPVICAIQGGCIGGALDLATACDLRVCSAWSRSCHRVLRARWPTPARASTPSARCRSASSTRCCRTPTPRWLTR
jgi:enoyl-CoA hydratase